MFSSSTTWDRSTMHPKFDPTGFRTHDLQIMIVHFMSLRHLSTLLLVYNGSAYRMLHNICLIVFLYVFHFQSRR